MRFMHLYEVRPRRDHRGVDLISDVRPHGRLWYWEPNAASHAIDYAKFRSRSHNAVIRVCDEAGNVIENARAQGEVQRVVSFSRIPLCRSSVSNGLLSERSAESVPLKQLS
jgi:hypothetical protein